MKSFEIVDFILSPTTPTTAFPLSNDKKDPTEMYLQDIYTTSVNLAGLPALSVPAGISEEKPVGLQIIGNYDNFHGTACPLHQHQHLMILTQVKETQEQLVENFSTTPSPS